MRMSPYTFLRETRPISRLFCGGVAISAQPYEQPLYFQRGEQGIKSENGHLRFFGNLRHVRFSELFQSEKTRSSSADKGGADFSSNKFIPNRPKMSNEFSVR